MLHSPKSISLFSNSRSELVTIAVTVNGTGLVWLATLITIGASSIPFSGSNKPAASSAKFFLYEKYS